LSSFAVWVNRVALNTQVFTDTNTELLDNDAIRSAISTRAVDELFDNVDVQAEVEAKLPEDVKSLSGPATAGLRQASYEIVDRALERPAFQTLFEITLEETHKTLVEVLEGGGSRVSTEGGEVTLDLRDIVRETADRIGIGEDVADKLPADAGRIVILRSDELDTAQDVFQLMKTLAWVLPLLTFAAFGLAVWLARDRRRAARGVGIMLVVVGALGLLAARLTQNYLINALTTQRDDREAADNAWNILTELMRDSFRSMVVVGILFVIAASLAGPGRRALAARHSIAPAFRNRVWAYVVLAIVVLFLLANGQVSDFTRFLFVAIVAALGATWIELTRKQTLHEFPDTGESTMVADARSRVSDWLDERRAGTPRKEDADVTAQLASLADLHSRGELSDEEYASAKARVLATE
ncbi:MAG: SHOCT domain-containing protein, partial [Thermoleophilia bacterium]|nr:SHOCT domain-containing protein [Thermoleophilia bacterium]